MRYEWDEKKRQDTLIPASSSARTEA